MALNEKFKVDNYISVFVGLEKSAGDPFKVGDLVGVCVTGSGSANPINNRLGDPNYNGQKANGVGNEPGWASVALAGGWEVNIPSGIRPVAVGDTLYITSGGALSKTAAGNTRFGKVTHAKPAGDDTTAIVKIVQ
jgi:hypothetical protein